MQYEPIVMLDPCQQAALAHINSYARSRSPAALELLEHILEMSNIPLQRFQEAVESLKARARVGLHFHPDRPGPDGRWVLETLIESGLYKSQFETLISNGSVSAHPGGPRDLWEQQLFGGAYRGARADQRPKYGSLDLLLHPDGPSPRFGSCYFLLKPQVTRRCTFSYMDSHRDPPQKGTLEELDDILCALFTESFEREFALGEAGLNPAGLLARLNQLDGPRGQVPARNLDFYIEAQVHGPIDLEHDVDTLVADPSFRSHPGFEELCLRYHIELRWHGGFRMAAAEVPSDFRGPAMQSLAARLGAELDPRKLGLAAQSLRESPSDWSDRGTPEQVLQEIKRLWHVLLRYGSTNFQGPSLD